MIPQFPKFKPIELSDITEVEKITSQYQPYSDYNFVSMWSWNISNEIAISQLNENLIVRFTDYITTKPFYSFIGDKNVCETAKTLLDFSIVNKLDPVLRLVPDMTASLIDSNIFEVNEDRDGFDYVYSIEEQRDLIGSKFSKKRNHVNAFLRTFPDTITKNLSLQIESNAEHIRILFDTIQKDKALKGDGTSFAELAVFERLLKGVNIFNLVTTGIYINEKLVAVLINELLNEGYAIGHLMGADTQLSSGLYSYLMKENAKLLSTLNIRLFNFEQDLGIENLRIAKIRFNPQTFLKKYTVGYSHQN